MLDFFAANKDAIIALGVFVSAIVSVLTAFISLTAARRNIRSQQREQWVERLRSDLAKMLSVRFFKRHEKEATSERKSEMSMEFSKLQNRILLRLNLNKKEHQALALSIEEFRSLLNQSHHDQKAFLEVSEAVRRAAAQIIRKECKRASKGK